MTEVVKAEFYALYQYMKIVEKCRQLAYDAYESTSELELHPTAFTRLPNAARVRSKWDSARKARRKEAAALEQELEVIEKALRSVAGIYGVTDAEMARRTRNVVE